MSLQCLQHARVYLLAERLCIDDLKILALKKMVDVLGNSNGLPTPQQLISIRSPNPQGYKLTPLYTSQMMSVGTLEEILRIVYENTPDSSAVDLETSPTACEAEDQSGDAKMQNGNATKQGGKIQKIASSKRCPV